MMNEPRGTTIPPQIKIINTTDLLVATTSGLCGEHFWRLAELIAGRTELRDSGPRPCLPDWVSLENEHAGKKIGALADRLIVAYISKMVESQQPELHALIFELRKYIPQLDKRDYPRPPEDQIKIWEENGVWKNNVKILNKQDELRDLVDPIRRRVGFSENLTFKENEETRASYNKIMKYFDTMNSIIFLDSYGPGPKNERDAVPRLPDNRFAGVIAETFAKVRGA
jgi:hypothetical protein